MPLVSLMVGLSLMAAGAAPYFRISIVDGETGRGVPLVLLRTGDYLEQYSDSAGNIAFYEPGLMDQPVWFSVLADGYNVSESTAANPTVQVYEDPYDSGVVLVTTTGASATVTVNRVQHAQRVYRLTGGGLYRDSVLTGDVGAIPPSVQARAVVDVPSGSIGQDTLQLATYKNATLWLFGDTACPRSARQNNCNGTGMYTVGAIGCLPSGDFDADCSPAAPPSLNYIVETSTTVDGQFHHPHPIAPIAPLDQNTWIAAMTVIGAGTPEEQLFAAYYKNPGDGAGPGEAAQGMCKWDDTKQQLIKVGHEWPRNASLSLNGAHAVQRLSPTDSAAVPQYVWYCNGFISSRVPANSESIATFAHFEVLPTPPPSPTWSCSTVNWNHFAQRYVCLGENLSIAFSHSLTGPYVNGSVVATHHASGSSCYNAVHMPHLDLSNGTIFFACTYTAMWSNNQTLGPNLWSTCLFGNRLGSGQGCAAVAPRYEYNNLVYRVELAPLLKWL